MSDYPEHSMAMDYYPGVQNDELLASLGLTNLNAGFVENSSMFTSLHHQQHQHHQHYWSHRRDLESQYVVAKPPATSRNPSSLGISDNSDGSTIDDQSSSSTTSTTTTTTSRRATDSTRMTPLGTLEDIRNFFSLIDKDPASGRFVCPYEGCPKTFNRRFSLRCHYCAAHAKMKDFSCDICGKSFAKKYDMNRHRRQVHKGIP
jgi:hypothetical protein